MLLTIHQIKIINKIYSKVLEFEDGFPKLPEDASTFLGFRQPVPSDYWISTDDGSIRTGVSNYYVGPSSARLIVLPKLKRYRFVAVSPEPGIRKKGDWIAIADRGGSGAAAVRFLPIEEDFPDNSQKVLIFRREEICNE